MMAMFGIGPSASNVMSSFLRCDFRWSRGEYDGQAYSLCDVVRVLDALDEERSRLKIAIREDERYSDFGKKYYSTLGGGDLVFRNEAIGEAHVFRMAYMEYAVISDQIMKNAFRAAGLRGILFDDVSRL